jgi:cystathionine gamma-synthase
MYWGLRTWLKSIEQFGHEVTFVDTSDLDAVRAAIRPGKTGLLWIETPGNPLWTISDIFSLADIAHEHDAILCVDSTVATPVFTQPLLLGADFVMHSATKYLNGHSDVVAGTLVTARRNDYWRRIETIRSQYGAILGPFEAWLLMRGMRTLEVRVNA